MSDILLYNLHAGLTPNASADVEEKFYTDIMKVDLAPLGYYERELQHMLPGMLTLYPADIKTRKLNECRETIKLLIARTIQSARTPATFKSAATRNQEKDAIFRCAYAIKCLENSEPQADYATYYQGLDTQYTDPYHIAKPYMAGLAFNDYGSRFNVQFRLLHGVWGRLFCIFLLEYIPLGFYYLDNLKNALSIASLSFGYMSFVLYYIRGSIAFANLLYVSISRGLADSKDKSLNEKLSHIASHLKKEWRSRKYLILNDFIWGAGNMATFFWLIGNGTLGYIGNAFTIALLVMDFSLSIMAYREALEDHIESLKAITDQITQLNVKADRAPDEMQKLARLEKQKKYMELTWQHQSRMMIKDMIYSAILIVAFGIFTACLTLPGHLIAPAVIGFGFIGAALCFALTLVNNAITSYMNIMKEDAIHKLDMEYLTKEIEEIQAVEYTLPTQDSTAQSTSRKYLTALINQRTHAEAMHAASMRNKKMQIVRTAMVDILIPTTMVTSLLFLPLPIAFAVIAAAALIATVSYYVFEIQRPQKLSGYQKSFFQQEAAALEKATLFQDTPTLIPNRSH